uniref:Uncharacterized protein n=1 Tax=Plectus sambesii TaxID=2011161 RepID=A0A914XKF8_9BILA
MQKLNAIVIALAAAVVLVSGDYQCANQPSTKDVKDDGLCRWFGAGPFCDGECVWPYTENGNQVSSDGCSTGNKVYCCKKYIGEGDNCAWFGNAPLCNGVCEPPYTHQCDTSTHGDGQSCWTGQKVLCCY